MGASSLRRRLVAGLIRPLPGQAILDIGCGTGSITRFLPKGVAYHGYDISEPYIAYARRHFADRGTFKPRAFSSEEIPSLRPIDTALALGLLHHLNDDECISLFRLIRRALKPDGRFISLDGCYTEGQNPIARFIIDRDRGRNVRDPSSYERLARTVFRQVEGKVHHRSWIPYTYSIMECSGTAEACSRFAAWSCAIARRDGPKP